MNDTFPGAGGLPCTGPREAADLEDALALARYRARQGAGEAVGVPHEQVRARLGLGPDVRPSPS